MALASAASIEVQACLAAYPAAMRVALLELRSLIIETASETQGVGELVETVKWGQPAFLPARPRTGTTIRFDGIKGSAERYALYFHCQTTLVSTFRQLYGGVLSFEGNRAILLSLDKKIPKKPLRHCVALALTYHLSRP